MLIGTISIQHPCTHNVLETAPYVYKPAVIVYNNFKRYCHSEILSELQIVYG
jgi:hypothetical protein